MILYWLTRFIVGVFAGIFFRLKVEGRENLPRKGGFILAANHASSLDPFMLIAAIPRFIRWTVIYEYYDLWYCNWALKWMRFIRLENNLPKQAFRALLQGEPLGIFPEGRRTWNGKLGPARPGVAALARRTRCPVIPVAIVGTFLALPRTRKRIRFHPVTVRIGAPLFFSTPENKKDSQNLDRKNSHKIMQAISALLHA